MTSYNLFLDDVRFPNQARLQSGYGLIKESGIEQSQWTIVRNYEDFAEHIEEQGIPQTVSFDHDLCENHMMQYLSNPNEDFDYPNQKVKTGFHCALFLIEKCKEKKVPLPKFFIHSHNLRGAERILQELIKYDNYI